MLFHRAARALIAPDDYDFDQGIPELRFNGKRAAFIKSDFQDFHSLLSTNVIWLNGNVLAYTDAMADYLVNFLELDPYSIMNFNLTSARSRLVS
jgi:hypothetical protein